MIKAPFSGERQLRFLDSIQFDSRSADLPILPLTHATIVVTLSVACPDPPEHVSNSLCRSASADDIFPPFHLARSIIMSLPPLSYAFSLSIYIGDTTGYIALAWLLLGLGMELME
jgi:hypothetical protein